MKNILKYCVILLLINMTSSCGGGSNTTETNNVGATANTKIDLNGKWFMSCTNNTIENYNISNNGLLDASVNIYLDNTCTQFSESHSSTARYTIGSLIISNDGLSAFEIDIQWDSNWFKNNNLQIIHRKGNSLYFGAVKKDSSRPTSMNLNKLYLLK